MDRFSQLEFDELKPERKDAHGEAIRNADYFHREALKYWLAGDYDLALRNYSRVLERNSTVFDAWSGQILMLIELGEYNEANIWADRAMEFFPEHPELLALKAVACVRDEKIEKAVAYSDNSVSKDNPTPHVWLARAEILFNKKSPAAESCVKKAVSNAGNLTPIIKLEAAQLLRRRGCYPDALDYLRDVIKIFPKSALVWYEMGYCQAQLGHSEATVSLEQSMKLHPNWKEPKEALARFEKRGFWARLFRR